VFLIFGLRVYYRVIGQGVFHCQRCGGDRPYRLRSGRRWFHLFFIPLIPLARLGEHVQCQNCRTAYRPEVLRLPTSEQMQAALPAGARAAAVTMLAAGDPRSPAARRRAIEVIHGAGLADYGEPALDADLAVASLAAADPAAADRAAAELATALNPLAIQLAVPAREWFLADIVRVGLADGALAGEERDAAHRVAAQLGMTPAQAYGVIAMTEESAPAAE